MCENCQGCQGCEVEEVKEIPDISESTLLDIVNTLNEDIYEQVDTDYEGEIYFEYQTIGVASVISFLGYAIWSSEGDGTDVTPQSIVDSANKLLAKVKGLAAFTNPIKEV